MLREAMADAMASRVRVAVLLPVYNAMPYLGDCVGDVLAQVGVDVSLLAVDDASQDGSKAYLERIAERQEHVHVDDSDESQARNKWEDGMEKKADMKHQDLPPGVEQVLARRRPGNRLVVLASDRKGHGHALNAALLAAQADYVGHMEADDLCPPDRFLKLVQAMQEDPTLDAACSQIGLVGHITDGMTKYAQWQNGLLTHQQMMKARFLEIPALHQSGLYKKQVLEDMCGYHENTDWPVDIDFWNRWFVRGYKVAKVPEPLYFWRQHRTQSTRTNRKNSLPNLQKCKVHYFCQPEGPAHGKRIQLWGRGETLKHISTLMKDAGAQLVCVDWKPGWPVPEAAVMQQGSVVRVFLFGSDKPRERIRREFPGFDFEKDWFLS